MRERRRRKEDAFASQLRLRNSLLLWHESELLETYIPKEKIPL